jgi:hypothetical protein
MVPRCVALPLERDEYAQGSLAGEMDREHDDGFLLVCSVHLALA